jgi:glycosyltransferase involved in cell wall biosynthesis
MDNLISVVIPMYNAESTIEQSIQSVLNQKYDCVKEIIVVDDGSTDNGYEIVKKLSLDEPRIVLITKENGGVSSARNVGLKVATGDYIAFLDSDDAWLPQKIERQMFIFNTLTDVAFIGTTLNGNTYKYFFFFYKFGKMREIKLKHQTFKNFFQPSTVLMKKKVFETVGFFNENQKYGEDANYFFRVCNVFKCVLLNEPLLDFGNGKLEFGQKGLSANLKEMEKGELQNLKFVFTQNYIPLLTYILAVLFSLIKYIRRIIIIKSHKFHNKMKTLSTLLFIFKFRFIVNKFFPKWALKLIKNLSVALKSSYYSRQYNGNRVFCPCCNKKFHNFMDFRYTNSLNNESRFINTYRNKVCPNCFSMPRHRMVIHYFSENKINLPADKILIFAVEYPIEKWLNKNGYKYSTADLFDRSADIKIDIQNIQFEDESWSLILCNHVLEHVSDYKIALKELRRILTKDGILEITLPTDRKFDAVYEDCNIKQKEERIEKFGQHDHLRIFGNDFKKTLEDTGFSVEVINGNELPAEIVAEIGPADYDDNRVYICTKNKQ